MSNCKLLPVEPTAEMIEAAREHHEGEAYLPTLQGESDSSNPVAAQHRFRHPQKSLPDWSDWQPSAISLDRPSWEIDSQGYEVEYRLLYDAPQSPPKEVPNPIELTKLAIDYGIMAGPVLHGSRYAHLSESERFDAFILALLARYDRPVEQQPTPDVTALVEALEGIVSDYEFCKANGDTWGDRGGAYVETARTALSTYREQGGEA